MLSAPTQTAPAASRRATSVASLRAGGRSRLIFEPASVVTPSRSKRFFTANATPAKGPSSDFARRRARASVTSVKALIAASFARILASVAAIMDAKPVPAHPEARAARRAAARLPPVFSEAAARLAQGALRTARGPLAVPAWRPSQRLLALKLRSRR